MVHRRDVGARRAVFADRHGQFLGSNEHDQRRKKSPGVAVINPEKLRSLMERVEARRGRFTLFGVFLREDSPGLWDLVIAAPWLQSDEPKALREFAKELVSCP